MLIALVIESIRRTLSFLADHYHGDDPEVEATTRLARRGFRIVEIPVAMLHRQGGVSSISSAGSIYHLLEVSVASLVSAGKRRGNRGVDSSRR